jgi:hypothetical protein
MNCADSPFDYIWTGRNDDDLPYLDVKLLRESIRDWEDLFAAKKIYIGLPAEAGRHSWSKGPVGESPAVSQSPFTDVKNTIQAELREIGFEAVVDTPRKALLRLAEEAAV